MNETMTTEPIDVAIGQVERLYRSLTGRDAPPAGETPYGLPPEKAPEQHLEEQVDRLLESLARFSHRTLSPGWVPLCSVWEASEETRICLDLPGISRESLTLRAVGQGWLEVTGERVLREVDVREGFRLRYAEQPQGEFRRTIPLPPGTSVEDLKARLSDGVLEIHIPRTDSSQDQSIPVT